MDPAENQDIDVDVDKQEEEVEVNEVVEEEGADLYEEDEIASEDEFDAADEDEESEESNEDDEVDTVDEDEESEEISDEEESAGSDSDSPLSWPSSPEDNADEEFYSSDDDILTNEEAELLEALGIDEADLHMDEDTEGKGDVQDEISVATTEELETAIKNAKAGDRIKLLAIDYYGNFVLPKFPGEVDHPVIIFGTTNLETLESTRIFPSGDPGTAFQVNGDNWILTNMTISSFDTAAVLEGQGNNLVSLIAENCNNGIRANGNKSEIKHCIVRGTGSGQAIDVKGDACSVVSALINSTGEGIIVSGQNPQLMNNTITAVPSLTVHPNVNGGTLKSNVLHGPASFSGNESALNANISNGEFKIQGGGNTFNANIANGGIIVSGSGNRFRGNIFKGLTFDNQDFHDDGANIFNFA